METRPSVSPAMRRLVLFVDRFTLFVTRHWLLLASVFLFLFAGLPFLPPALMHSGFVDQAQWLYTLYSFNCHQLAYRSYFFFGAQNVYPPEQLTAAYAAPKDDLFFWRNFIGNAQLGWKMAWCERDTAMYGSLFFASLFFGLARRWLRPLDWRVYALLLTPMALDGLTQLFGLRESDALLRTLTGVLFGIGSAWVLYPHLETIMRELEQQARAQYERALRGG